MTDTPETQMSRIMSNLESTLEAPVNDTTNHVPDNEYLPTAPPIGEVKKWSPPTEDIRTLDRNFGFHQQTPLQSIAGQLSRLIYEDMMEMASELHSDSDGIGKSPADIAAILHKWAKRKLDAANK